MISKNFSQPDKTIIIDSLSGFNKWRHELRTLRINNGSNTYTLNLQELSKIENEKISNLIKTYNNECGCKTGSFFMSLVFGITIISYFVTGGKFSSITFKHISWIAGITFIAALAGKLFGLIQARWKLIKLSNDINQKLRNTYPKQSVLTNQ